MARIAIGGMQHETNTFAPTKADYRAFEHGGGWPSVQLGDQIFDAVDGANLPVTGAIDALRRDNHTLYPLAWAAASPSAHVTDDAFERIVGSLCDRLIAAGPVDGVYLDLHGAMVTESHDDGEGEILRRVREIVGPRVPVAASLDLHGNVTQQMVDQSDVLSIYRTYPHVDMALTGARTAGLLTQMLRSGQRFSKSFQRFDFLTGLPSQSTFIEPAKTIYEHLQALEDKTGVALSFAMGFPMADFDECGMTALAYGDSQQTDRVLASFCEVVNDAESKFKMKLFEPDEAIQRANGVGQVGRPAVIADTQDNPGAGGNGDTTGLLDAMLRLQPKNAVLGLLIDEAAASKAHELGEGASAGFSLGATSGVAGIKPVEAIFKVDKLASGQFTCTGPMFRGFRMNLGPMAVLSHGHVKVVVASRKCQAADQEMFRHVGIEPSQQRVVALKSSVHFRADFQPISSEIIVARAPGPCLAHPADFQWSRLRDGLRIGPGGDAFRADPADH